VQVSVPTANMEEIIPAARLLSRATALTHSDYERAKSAFLTGMDASGLAAQVNTSQHAKEFLHLSELAETCACIQICMHMGKAVACFPHQLRCHPLDETAGLTQTERPSHVFVI